MDAWWGWSYLLAIVGGAGFWLSGRKVWWSWWINVGCQGLWVAYAIATRQWGFLATVPLYLSIFLPNAIRWTREHRAQGSAAERLSKTPTSFSEPRRPEPTLPDPGRDPRPCRAILPPLHGGYRPLPPGQGRPPTEPPTPPPGRGGGSPRGA